jgi:hypothetical protein
VVFAKVVAFWREEAEAEVARHHACRRRIGSRTRAAPGTCVLEQAFLNANELKPSVAAQTEQLAGR